MPNGMGFGRGFGFRGCSPARPYAGRGRGGLPRCLAAGLQYNLQATTSESEVGILRNQASDLRRQLELVETRIRNLEQIRERKEQ